MVLCFRYQGDQLRGHQQRVGWNPKPKGTDDI
jgi:hypothetical protein